MKLTCPNCGREHPLREPFPAPGSRIVCACGRRLSVQYPAATLEQLRKRGARFQSETESALSAGASASHAMDDEATSLFTAEQIEEASRAARTAGGTLVPEVAPPVRPMVRALPPAPSELRRVPDHGPTALFPFSGPGGKQAPPPPPPSVPGTPPVRGPNRGAAPALPADAAPKPHLQGGFPPASSFEEEPTALFMSDGDIREAALRHIPDHGKTGLVYPVGGASSSSEPPVHRPSPIAGLGGGAGIGAAAPSAQRPPPSVPQPPSPVGKAAPLVIEAPNAPHLSFSNGQELTAATFEAPVAGAAATGASSMEPVESMSGMNADQAFPESASGVRRGATLDEIMKLKVMEKPVERPIWDKVPRFALVLLVLLGLGGAALVLTVIVVLATR